MARRHVAAFAMGAVAAFAAGTVPSAAADSSNHIAVCSSHDASGVDTDQCVPNPVPDNPGHDPTDNYPQVLGELVLGAGG